MAFPFRRDAGLLKRLYYMAWNPDHSSAATGRQFTTLDHAVDGLEVDIPTLGNVLDAHQARWRIWRATRVGNRSRLRQRERYRRARLPSCVLMGAFRNMKTQPREQWRASRWIEGAQQAKIILNHVQPEI